MSGKRRVFVSSVQRELATERRALREFIEGDPLLRRFFDVFLFEDLAAADRQAEDVYLFEVDRCEIYLGLLGNEYGFEDSAGVSPTEREFDRATSAGRTRLVFVRGQGDSDRHPKMSALVRKAQAQLVRRRFGSLVELIAAVRASLVEHLVEAGVIVTKRFDQAACPDATLADLAGEKVAAFLARARNARGFPLAPDTPVRDALAHLNLLDGEAPSHAAILLFASQPQRFLLSSEVKCASFHGIEVSKPIPSYQIYKGAVFELVDQAVDFVMSKIARRVGTRAEGPEAPVDYELPREAVTEAIVNAVAHRDYSSNASVQVSLFADRLEVWNPGQLPPPLTPASLRVPHPSIPRNPLLADALFLARYIEKAGTGTLDMIKLCREAGLADPEFRQDGGQFTQVLRRPVVAPTAVVGEAERVLVEQLVARLSAAFPALTAQVTAQVAAQVVVYCREPRAAREIMEHLGLRHWQTFQSNYLRPLVASGLIERTIPEKPTSRLQKYRLTEQGRALLPTARP